LNAFRALSHGAAHETEASPLVNNYRPVQKIGTRTVVRTFAVETTASGTVNFHRFHEASMAAAAAVLMLRLLY